MQFVLIKSPDNIICAITSHFECKNVVRKHGVFMHLPSTERKHRFYEEYSRLLFDGNQSIHQSVCQLITRWCQRLHRLWKLTHSLQRTDSHIITTPLTHNWYHCYEHRSHCHAMNSLISSVCHEPQTSQRTSSDLEMRVRARNSVSMSQDLTTFYIISLVGKVSEHSAPSNILRSLIL